MRLRLLALAAAVLLGPAPEVCGALNVTVSPGPVVDYLEGENATLLCHVSQKRRKDSLLAVRWFFAPDGSQEALMVKMTKLRIIQYYGNFSRTANQQRLRLLEERRGVLYRLSVLTLRPTDQGQYVCKVQEISKHRNKWTAWSNGSSATEMRVISLKAGEDSSFEKKKVTWAFFEDLYVYAVLVCCVGILSVLLFTLVIAWQSVFHKRKSRVRHYLVKCPQNSSGETVTSVTSLAPLQPQKGKRQKKKVDVPPAVPAKAPIATTFHKPKLLKPQRKVALAKASSRVAACKITLGRHQGYRIPGSCGKKMNNYISFWSSHCAARRGFKYGSLTETIIYNHISVHTIWLVNSRGIHLSIFKILSL